MKPMYGICSSQVFFSVAALTGCISVIINMTVTDSPLDSGGLSARRELKFGPTYVVEPKGKHQATIVWLHGLGDDGSSWSQLLENLHLPNIKWICPTSPAQPFTLFGGLSTTAYGVLLTKDDRHLHSVERKIVCNCKGFDVIDMSEDASQDVEGMDASAGHVLSLLSTEPPNFKVGVGGFSMGAATAIYAASCFTRGKFGNGTDYSTHLDVVVALSGWLPCARGLNNEFEGYAVESRAASLPILLCHGRGDDVVRFRYGDKSAEKLTSAGFENLTFKFFPSLGHYIIPEEMDEVSSWLTLKLGLEGVTS